MLYMDEVSDRYFQNCIDQKPVKFPWRRSFNLRIFPKNGRLNDPQSFPSNTQHGGRNAINQAEITMVDIMFILELGGGFAWFGPFGEYWW